jgi:hypothetical protein
MMNSRCTSSIFFKTLRGLVVLSILFNSLLPRFAFNSIDTDTFDKILKSQSVLVNLFTLSSLPVMIVNDIVLNHAKTTHQTTKQNQKKDSKKQRNTSADYSLVNSEKREQMQRSTIFRAVLVSDRIPMVKDAVSSACQITTNARDLQIFLLMITMLFILRPRSSVGENAVFSFAKNI